MARLQVWNFSMGHKGYNGSSVDAWCPGPNSAGGVSVQFSFKNLTEKTIKYKFIKTIISINLLALQILAA